uniref:Secreted protein n=1 Tax=Rhinopithecus roxellana TaxID=61622 RepID=A0A2K6PXG6_RHIRO
MTSGCLLLPPVIQALCAFVEQGFHGAEVTFINGEYLSFIQRSTQMQTSVNKPLFSKKHHPQSGECLVLSEPTTLSKTHKEEGRASIVCFF